MMQQKKISVKNILLTGLCVLIVFVLTGGLLLCMTLRYYVKSAAIPQAVESVILQNTEIQQADGTKTTLAKYILDHFIQDDRVTVDEVQQVLEQGTFLDYAKAISEQYHEYLDGTGDCPEMSSEKIIQLLEENSSLIYEKTGLHVLAPDKEKLKQNLNQPLFIFNKLLELSLYHGKGGFLLKAMVSVWLEVLLGILLIACLVWLIKIHHKPGRVLKIYGITAFVPSTALFLTGLFLSLVIQLFRLPAELGTALRGKTVFIAGISMLVCALVFMIGKIWSSHAGKLPEVSAFSEISAEPENPVTDHEKRNFCRYCGKQLVNPDAKFCYHCGRMQELVKK